MYKLTLTFVDEAEARYYVDAMNDLADRDSTSWQDKKDCLVMAEKLENAILPHPQTAVTSYYPTNQYCPRCHQRAKYIYLNHGKIVWVVISAVPI